MVILGLEFFALIVICYVYYVYATRDQISGGKDKKHSGRFRTVIFLIFFAMFLFASWYVSLGLAD
jgi:hypothetical protein